MWRPWRRDASRSSKRASFGAPRWSGALSGSVRLGVACMALAGLTAVATPAWGQPSDGNDESEDEKPEEQEPSEEELAAARSIFKEGIALEKKNQWEQALEKFEAVAAVKRTPQVEFHIGLCNENLGRWVAAINAFERAEDAARDVGDKAKNVLINAPKRAAALHERVPHVQIDVTGKITISKVLLDGKRIAEPLFNTKLPVDVGDHVVALETDGEVVFEKPLTLAEKGFEVVELRVDDPDPPPTPPIAGPIDEPDPDKPKVKEEPPSKVPAYVAGGIGIASLAGAGVFFALRESAIAEVRESCNGDDQNCDPDLQARADDGQTFTLVAGILGGVGIASLATAGVLYFIVLEPDDDAASALPLEIRVAPTPSGIVINGTF